MQKGKPCKAATKAGGQPSLGLSSSHRLAPTWQISCNRRSMNLDTVSSIPILLLPFKGAISFL
jgi:hypothetical protein